MEVVEVQVGDVACISTSAQGLDKTVGNAGHAAQVDMGVRRDVADRFVRGYILYLLHKIFICRFADAKIVK